MYASQNTVRTPCSSHPSRRCFNFEPLSCGICLILISECCIGFSPRSLWPSPLWIGIRLHGCSDPLWTRRSILPTRFLLTLCCRGALPLSWLLLRLSTCRRRRRVVQRGTVWNYFLSQLETVNVHLYPQIRKTTSTEDFLTLDVCFTNSSMWSSLST